MNESVPDELYGKCSVDNPILTIAIPTYNRSHYLDGCLASITSQSSRIGPQDLEVVVTDNGTDAADAVARQHAQRATFPIRYHRNETNIGGLENILLGLKLARGRFWMFYGDDDLVPPDRLRQMVTLLLAHPDQPAVFFQLEGADPGVPNVAVPTAISLEQGARGYFYDFGNAGRFAVRTDLARFVLAQLPGVEKRFWPQTEIGFAAMAQSGQEQPLLLAPFPSSASPYHAANTIYTCTYVWCTVFRDLLRTAVAIRGFLGEAAFDAACEHLFSWTRLRGLAKSFAVCSLVDDAESTRRVRRSIAEVAKGLPWRIRVRLVMNWSMLLVPRWMRYGILWLGLEARRWLHGGRRKNPLRRIVAEQRKRRAEAKASQTNIAGFTDNHEVYWGP